MKGKRILAFILAVVMILGDAAPVFATELSENISQENMISNEIEKEETESEGKETESEVSDEDREGETKEASEIRDDENSIFLNNTPPKRLTVEVPEASLGPENLNYTWNVVDGGTMDSSCTEDGRMKLLVFAPYWSYHYLSSFYVNPLLRDNKYLDVVILDTMGADPDEIKRNFPEYEKNNYPDAPITYCYSEWDFEKDKLEDNPILRAYNEYRELVGMGELTDDIRGNQVTGFLIDGNNEVVYWGAENDDKDYSTGETGYGKLIESVVSEINEKQYLRSETPVTVSFRKDGEGWCRFEWEKNAGVKQFIIYSDPDENNILARNCDVQSSVFDDADDPDGWNKDEGYALCGLMDQEKNILCHQIILLDRYGLYAAVSEVEKPKGNMGANLDYTWNTVDGTTIGSKNTGNKKMKVIVLTSMKNQSDGMQHFFNQPLFRGKDYIEVVVLDTSQLSKSELKTKKDNVEKYNFISGSDYVLKYCYDTSTTGVKDVYERYCEQVGVTEEYDSENVAYFLVDQNNQIVDYRVLKPDPSVPSGMSMQAAVFYITNEIEEKGYLTSTIAAPKVRIKEHKEGKIVLAWDKVSGAGGYKVYRSETGEDGSWWPLEECPVDSYQHVTEWTDYVTMDSTGKNPTYYYKVATKDAYWVLGGYSEVVTNDGLPMDVDPQRFKALHLVDENGKEVTSLNLQKGETKHVYLELERYSGEKIRVNYADYIQWEIMRQRVEESGEEARSVDVSGYQPDDTDEYAAWWFEKLTDQNRVNVTGMGVTEEEKRYLYCLANGMVDGQPYSLDVIIPIQVTAAQGTFPEVDMTPKDSYTDREVLNRYVREQFAAREERVAFCVPRDVWDAWNRETRWTPERDAMDFYEDHEGMKSWEGDYIFYSIRNFRYPLYDTSNYNYRKKDYFIYTIDCTYWDTVEQEQKVNAKLNELIWDSKGALSKYHDSAEHEIVKACMDWIGKNVSYIGTTDYRYHSAYSALFNKKATCEGYSLLLYRMLREFGISNRILMGMDTNAHTYNIVEIDGLYYYTDPTSGALLKGSNNFKHADWQERFLDPEFTEKVASRISKTDYVYIPKNVRLYELTEEGDNGQIIGNYKTFSEAIEKMETDGKYRITLLGNTSLVTGKELEYSEGTEYQLDLNGYTLTVPVIENEESVTVSIDIYGGSTDKGILKVAKGQKLALSPQGNNGNGRSVKDITISFDTASGSLALGNGNSGSMLMLQGVSVTGTPNISIGSNVTLDAKSTVTAGELTIPETSKNIVLDGKITAKSFRYGAVDTIVNDLNVSGQTTVKGSDSKEEEPKSGVLCVKGNVAFNTVVVENGIFFLDLLKVSDGNGAEIGTGTATFKGALTKAAGETYAVKIERKKMARDSAGTPEVDPFMPDDTLVSVTAKESVAPTGYFRIPDDPAGRKLSLVREGNVLKIKGVVVEVSLNDQQGTEGYISLDAAVSSLAADFGSQKGEYQFTFLSDACLTKNLTIPVCVEKLELKAAQKGEGQIFARLDFKNYTLSTAASVKIQEGLQLISSNRKGILNLTGDLAKGEQLRTETFSGNVTWVDVLGNPIEAPNSSLLTDGVNITAAKGKVVLNAGDSQMPYRLNSDISAKELHVESGKWDLCNVTTTGLYQISETAEAVQSKITLTNKNAIAEIAGRSTVKETFTMSGTRLFIEESGRLEADVEVKAAYGQESANGNYTIENRGYFGGNSLKMPKGIFRNYGVAQLRTVSGMNCLENMGENALFMSFSLNQTTGNRIRLMKDSTLVVGEKAVLYNAELGGAKIYQATGCDTALEGKVTLSGGFSKETAGLQYALISKENFETWWDSDAVSADGVEVEEIAPQTRLFTTKISAFPTEYVKVCQKDENSEYTKLYQIGQNVRVGKDWILISAQNADGEETELGSFLRWQDAVKYISDPKMVYIVDILEDLDIEQGLTMPNKLAGMVIRGASGRGNGDGTGPTILTYTGDLNLTKPLEFSGIELKAKKGSAAYESVVKLNGMKLIFSHGAKGTFASVNGNASSVLALDDNAEIEVHGAVNVGQLHSDGSGSLTGLATITSKAGEITAVTPQITVNGQTDIRNGQITIRLQKKVTQNKVDSYETVDFSADAASDLLSNGIRLAKAVYAKPGDFRFSPTGNAVDTRTESGIMSKKDGYLTYYETFEYGVTLLYGAEGEEEAIPFKTFGDAVAEINGLKTKRAYTIRIEENAAELTEAAPAVLGMPNKNYISSLRIEAADDETADLYYLNNMTLTANTVLKNIAFIQMVKVGKLCTPVHDQKKDYPSPMNLSTGGFKLSIEGNVTFNTPLNLDGGNSGTFSIGDGASLVTATNEVQPESDTDSVIVGTIKRFKEFNVLSGQKLQLEQYGTKSAKGISYKAAELNVTAMKINGTVLVKEGNATVRDLILEGGTLKATGGNAGKISLTNVTLQGDAEIHADRDFSISGTLANQTESATLSTRQKVTAKGVVQPPYLSINGKVILNENNSRIIVRVLPNDCTKDDPVELSKNALQPAGQLLTAKTAGAECFKADKQNIDPKNSENVDIYSPERPDGYMLVKSGNNIYIYDSEQVAVALCKGDASDGDWNNATVINYYPGWQEAGAALNALNQAKESYTILLLKDVGTKKDPLKLTLPSKASKVYVASVAGEQKKIYYQNDLSLGTNTVFANVALNPVTSKGVGMNVGNYELTLSDIQMGETGGSGNLKAITGKGKGNVVLTSEGLIITGGISGVSELTVGKDTTVKGAVKANILRLQGGATLTTENAVTVTDIENRSGQNTLVYDRTNNLTNLTVNGTIRNEDNDGGSLRLVMTLPAGKNSTDYPLVSEDLKTTGKKVILSDTKKLAVMPKASTSDFAFCISRQDGTYSEPLALVKAAKSMYVASEAVVSNAVELYVKGKPGKVRCLDLTQAVNEINTLADGKAEYTLYLPGTGIYEDTNLTDSNPYGPLTMPGNGKAGALTLSGRKEGVEERTVLYYTGTLKPTCPITFEDIVMTEGTSKNNVFTPAWQITLAAEKGDVTFRNTATLKGLNEGENEAKADLVFASANVSKGKVTLQDETVYAKGNFVVQNLYVSGSVVLMSDKAVTLTNITGENSVEDGVEAKLVLDTKTTVTTNASQQSVTQLTINGKIRDVKIGIAPQIYDFSKKEYHRLTVTEAKAMWETTANPTAGQKLANTPKNFADVEAITLLHSYEDEWKEVGTGTSGIKYDVTYYVHSGGGLYMRAEQSTSDLNLPETWKEELQEAKTFGLPLEGLGQETVSGREMAALLDALVKYAAPEKLAEWQALLPELATCDAPLTRFDAMGALYLAAQTIGGRWADPVENIREVWTELNFQFDGYFFSEGLFSKVDGPHFMIPNSPKSESYLDMACLCYTLSRRSPISGELLFAYDKEKHSIREDAPPTYAEAALAVTRLILSDQADNAGAFQTVSELSSAKDAELRRNLQTVIDGILSSETKIVPSSEAAPGKTYTGTAYYVSVDGNDDNDGLSPEKAWRTLEKVAEEAGAGGQSGKLKPGDAVFFRRGDVFRFAGDAKCLIIKTPGITFSAYGEGAKPVITGSSESGVGAEKWKLIYDEGGRKIWQYYKDMPDIACIVLNDGEKITMRVYEFCGENGYESCDCDADTWLMQSNEKGVDLKGELLSPGESLTEDMTIISRPACSGTGSIMSEFGTGPLYLRCDAGNPGELFSSVEFSERQIMALVWLEVGDTVIDNISFLCNGTAYIKGIAIDKNWRNVRNTVVQNCEFAFGGGSVTYYLTADNGEAFVYPQGDGIYDVISNTTICGNYFHDSLSVTASYEQTSDYDSDIAKAGPADGYYHVLDNVMVNTMGIRIDSTSDLLKELDSVVIRGNQIWNTGRMDNSGYYYSEGAVFLAENHYEEFIIEGNVFYGTENGYISNGLFNYLIVNLRDSTMPTLAGNTYVQHRGRPFVYFREDDTRWNIEDPDLIRKVRFLLRDTTSEFYSIGAG